MFKARIKCSIQVQESGQINGFSYPFLNRLLMTALEAQSSHQLFSEMPQTENGYGELYPYLGGVLRHIANQTKMQPPCDVNDNRANPHDVEQFLNEAHRFIEIFGSIEGIDG